jgi:hypothetical protein
MNRKTPTPKQPAPRKRPAARTVAKKRSTKTPRAAKPTAAAPTRTPRRAIFIDVENTSSEESLLTVIEHLKIDRTVQPTELIAAGNWRSVGARVARLLGSLGAQLVHSAPAVGVRDWSDLWIAVAAGRWLGTAAAGDTLEIVSDDRAFDAVADTAASIGIVFKRISYRNLPSAAPPSAAPAPTGGPRPQPRHRRGRRGRGTGAAHPPAPAAAPQAPPAAAPHASSSSTADEEAHAASQEQVRAALARLAGGSGHWINLDVLANALKAEGFVRPPGSPRLVTRLRKMKDVEISPNGMVRLLGLEAAEPVAPATEPPQRRPRRRGGRRRHHPRPAGESGSENRASVEE